MAEGGVKLWGKFGMRGRGALALCTLLLKMVSVHTKCLWNKSCVCEMLFGELPFQYNHHGWWRLLGSDWRRSGVCNVLNMFGDTVQKQRKQVNPGVQWENSYVPCHTTVPLFLSPPCSFLLYLLIYFIQYQLFLKSAASMILLSCIWLFSIPSVYRT